MADKTDIDEFDVANATYEELADLDKEFDNVETEIMRYQHTLHKPLYEKREKLIAKIDNFWPVVFEQAPPDIDQYIHPTDSVVLLASLTSISVSRFEIENGGKGDPRSVSIKMEFAENQHFEDKVLEKKFWYRVSKDGDTALVSEPVPIRWKEGRDLTQGMLDLAVKVWEADKKKGPGSARKIKKEADYTPDEKALREKVSAGVDGLSFFAWFGFRGLDISEEESRAAIEEDRKKRAERAAGKVPELVEAPDEDEDEDEDDEANPFALEIFPDGDELALAISDDLWPGAIKYYTQTYEGDISEIDFEDMDEDTDGEDANGDGAQPPSKKQKS
ncbi:nucleosome assembly protein [Xylariaceae sp. FL0662B]|nr:nucleosome assembly protein [Xylariaceae sp. FL0662B]